jgi:hypothetical protein
MTDDQPDLFQRNYVNQPLRDALDAFAAEPSIPGIERALAAAIDGGLVIDITGSNRATGLRVREVAATTGGRVLPVFSSLAELGLAVPAHQRKRVQGSIVSGKNALSLMYEDEGYIAAQFDAGSRKIIVKREFVVRALELTAVDDAASASTDSDSGADTEAGITSEDRAQN